MFNPYFNNNAFSNYNSQYNPAAVGLGYGQPQKQEITEVYGVQGAQAYQMPPNSSAILLDANTPQVYIKRTDGAGSASIATYKLIPYTAESDSTAELEKRVRKLEEIINESNSCNVTDIKRESAQSDSYNKKHAER